jgi:hypothetical protein
VLDDAKTSSLRTNTTSKLLEEKDVSLQGFKGRELVIETPKNAQTPDDVILRMRVFPVKSKLIQVISVTAKSIAEKEQENIAYFLDSVRLRPDELPDRSAGLAVHWTRYSFTQEGFSIMVPLKPSVRKLTTTSDLGPQGFHIFRAQESPQRAYVVSFSRNPATFGGFDDEAILERIAQGAGLNVPGANIKRENKVTLGSFPGREIWIALPENNKETTVKNATMRQRVYLVKEVMYQLMFIGSAEDASSADVDRFMSSLQLTKTEGVQPPEVAESVPAKDRPKFVRGSKPDWWRVEPADGRYTVEFPGEPADRAQTVQTSNGERSVRVLTLTIPKRGAYLLMENPDFVDRENAPRPLLDRGLQQAASRLIQGIRNAKVRSESVVDVDGFPGRDYQLEVPPAAGQTEPIRIQMRLIVAGRRNYILQRVGPVSVVTDEDIADFFNSFRLLSPPASGGDTPPRPDRPKAKSETLPDNILPDKS